MHSLQYCPPPFSGSSFIPPSQKISFWRSPYYPILFHLVMCPACEPYAAYQSLLDCGLSVNAWPREWSVLFSYSLSYLEDIHISQEEDSRGEEFFKYSSVFPVCFLVSYSTVSTAIITVLYSFVLSCINLVFINILKGLNPFYFS